MTPREQAEALVVVVPQPDGRGLVTVVGSGVGCGGPLRLEEGRSAYFAVQLQVAQRLPGYEADMCGAHDRAKTCVAVSEREPRAWFLTICGEDLPGAEPLAEAEARRERIVARLARVLDPEPCTECFCSSCSWALRGEVPCASPACRACGCPVAHDEVERLARLRAEGQRVADELGLTATPAPAEEPAIGDPGERLRRALDAADRFGAGEHSDGCPHSLCPSCDDGEVDQESCEADGAGPCDPEVCWVGAEAELHAAARAVLEAR